MRWSWRPPFSSHAPWHPEAGGAVSFHATQQSHSVSNGGENMWFTNDAFHFA